MPTERPAYTWDAKARKFRDAAGRAVPDREVRSAVDALADAAGDRARADGDAFARGEINDAEYALRVRDLVRTANVAAATAAAGGWRQATAAEIGAAGRRSKAAYGELDRMLAQYHRGEITGPQLAARAAMLPKTARGTFEAIRAKLDAAAGLGEERRTLGGNENHCRGCIHQAALGWQPTGSLLPIGDCECGGNCLCSVERRPAAPALPVAAIRFVPAPHAARDAVVRIDPRRLDEALALDPDKHVGTGGAGVSARPGAYRNALEFLARAAREGIAVESPRLGLDAAGVPVVVDGRHRLAALRDAGAHAVPVTVPRRDAAAFRRRFGARP